MIIHLLFGRFYQHLAMNMSNHYKTIYAASAEVVGMAIKVLSEKEKNEEAKEWRESFMTNIAKMLTPAQTGQPDLFITCVHRMQIHYPPIADRYKLTKFICWTVC